MPEAGDVQSANTWPLVKFQFSVKIGTDEFLFQEVTGLSAETQVIEYRVGHSKMFSTVKMPGIKKYGNITLKKGIFKGDTKLWDMYLQVNMNVFKRQNVVVSLLDEAEAVAMTWTFMNAFPTKMSVADLKSDASDPAVETMELAHEGFSLTK